MATTVETTEAAADLAHETAKVGMPQLDFSLFPNQIFWLLVTLAVIYFILANIALPRIGGTLASRKAAIASDLAAAEELKQKAKAAEKAYDDALVTARAESAKIMAAAQADIKLDLDAAIAKADAEIAHRSAKAATQIDEIRAGAAEAVSDVARSTTEALVASFGAATDAATVSAAVSARLKG
ncbi:MAG: F0F1 ATP synthase subunit B' [Alphaproteobacteria bacterium]